MDNAVADKTPHNLIKDLTDDIEGIIRILNDTYEFIQSRVKKIQYMKNRLQNLCYTNLLQNKTEFFSDHSIQEKSHSFLNNLNFSFRAYLIYPVTHFFSTII